MMNRVTVFFVIILFIACGFSCLTLFSKDDVGTIGSNDRPEKVFSFLSCCSFSYLKLLIKISKNMIAYCEKYVKENMKIVFIL